MLHNLRLPPVRRIALGAAFACLALSPAAGQEAARELDQDSWIERRVDGLERGLAFFGAGRDERPATRPNVQQAQSSMGDIAVRLDRLENQMRQLNGRIDELQFQGRRNDEALKRFQGDVDFRLQDLEAGKSSGGAKPGKRTDAGAPSAGEGGAPAATARAPQGDLGGPSGGGASASRGGGDAIGGLIDDGPDEAPNGPMRISPPALGGQGSVAGATGAVPRGGSNSGGSNSGGSSSGMSVGTGSVRDQFDMGVGFVQRRDYELAEQTFRDFLRAHPNDPLAADARYWLGESLYQRRQYTDAADSFYKIYVDAPQSAKAPESMLKLGMSLNGMGKKEEACATIAEAGKKYSRIRSQSDRELKRISC